MDGVPVPDPGTPAGRLLATEALLLSQRLIVLDDLWTAMSRAIGGDDERYLEPRYELGALVEALNQGLTEIEDRAKAMGMTLEMLDGTSVARAFRAIDEATNAPMSPGTQSLLEFASPVAEFQPAAIRACSHVQDEAANERSELLVQLDAVERGERPPGSFRREFKCALYLMAIGAAAAATIGLAGPPVFVTLSVVGIVGQMPASWSGAGCPSWSEIRW
jgi:hypothetical protein